MEQANTQIDAIKKVAMELAEQKPHFYERDVRQAYVKANRIFVSADYQALIDSDMVDLALSELVDSGEIKPLAVGWCDFFFEKA